MATPSEPILTHVYPNGLALIAEPMPSLQSAAFTFLAPAGCAYDPADRSGLATFTNELLIRGCGERDSRQFVLDLDNLGVERSEAVHDSHTAYGGATLAENLPATLEIYADLLRRPHLPDEQMEAARLVLLQELRAVEDEPAQKVMIELRRRHYPYPWGRPPHGELAPLESISRADVCRYYTAHYRPNGTILGVAGRIDWDALRDAVARLFGDWPAAPEPPLVEQTAAGGYQHSAFAANQTQIGIAYDSVPYRHPDYFPAWGAVGVLSGGMSSRLFTEVREKRGLCYSVYASYHTLRDRGGVFCYAGSSADRAQETLDVTLGELDRLADGVEEEELSRLKARIKSALIMQQESSSSRSASLARDWHHLGRARTLDELGQLVDGLSCASINRYLRERPPGNFTVVTLGPAALEVARGVS